jgi:hypothetical protein
MHFFPSNEDIQHICKLEINGEKRPIASLTLIRTLPLAEKE